MILGLSWKQILSQKRPVGTGQKSSDDEVSEFVIPNKKGMISEIKMKKMNPYLLIEECLYSMCEMVICLVTVLIVEESGGFGGNFHNRHGSYLNWTSVP